MTEQIDIINIAKRVLRRWLLILVISITVAVLSVIVVICRYQPAYQTQATIAVYRKEAYGSVVYDAQETAAVFQEIITSNLLQKKVAEEMKISALPGWISSQVVPKTNMITLTATAYSPQDAMTVINGVLLNHQVVTAHLLSDVVLQVLDTPVVPTEPVAAYNEIDIFTKAFFLTAAFLSAFLFFLFYFHDYIKNEKQVEIFIKAVKKFRIPMAVVTAVMALGYFTYSWVTFVPYYQSQVTFSVNIGDAALALGGSSGAEQIKGSLPYILKSQYMKNLVMKDLELEDFTAEIELESKELANFFILKITSKDAKESYQIINSMIDNCPGASVYVLGQITLEILDESGISSIPVNEFNKGDNLMKGVLAGMALCAGFIFLYALPNRTIRKE